MNKEKIKKSILVFDIETSAKYPTGELIDISANFDDYVKFAKVKWLGMYSYLLDEYVEINVMEKNPAAIRMYIAQHDILVGFNNEEFDTPIMYNNGLMPEDKRFTQVDCLVTLGSSTYQRHDGLPFKNRGALMGYKFKKNSLKAIAEAMDLETQKGDIDYMIFMKTSWAEEEKQEIKKYLRADVKATKQMFDKLWEFWMPFTEFISEDNVKKLTWIRSSIASLTYQAACKTLGVEETYAEKTNSVKEEMGGRVIQPKYEEERNVWYVDFTSLYPHIFTMFNLFAEKKCHHPLKCSSMYNEPYWFEDGVVVESVRKKLWHGNNIFKVKGYYDISTQHKLSIDVANKLKERIRLKKEDPNNPLAYALKIFLNSLYGAVRSEVFEQIHTPNAGWDCCWLGQQIQEYTEERMKEFGFETIAGDTDSIFVVLKDNIDGMHTHQEEEIYVKDCLSKIVQEIKDNVPFPCDTFNIDIEEFLDYVMWPFSLEPEVGEDGKNLKNEKGRLIKKLKGKKKNYVYIYHKNKKPQLKIVGLPIKKDNATALGPKILEQTLKPLIFEKMSAKFDKMEIDKILKEWLAKPESIKDLAIEFKVKPNNTYKPNKDGSDSNNIYAQISRGYFNGQAGVVRLIKNKKVGRAGKTSKHATYEEIEAAKIGIEDLDLTKINNELSAFRRN